MARMESIVSVANVCKKKKFNTMNYDASTNEREREQKSMILLIYTVIRVWVLWDILELAIWYA